MRREILLTSPEKYVLQKIREKAQTSLQTFENQNLINGPAKPKSPQEKCLRMPTLQEQLANACIYISRPVTICKLSVKMLHV